MNDNLIMLVMMEAGSAIKPDDSLEDRCRSAMKAAKNHWMVLDEDSKFKGAVAALYEQANEDEKVRIKAEFDSLKFLSAMLNGVPVDFDAIEPLENPVGLNKIWREVTEPSRAEPDVLDPTHDEGCECRTSRKETAVCICDFSAPSRAPEQKTENLVAEGTEEK